MSDALDIEIDPTAGEAPADPVDYERAFHELYEHSQTQANQLAQITAERDGLVADIAELVALRSQVADLQAVNTVREARLASLSSEADTLRVEVVEAARQRREYKLWAARGPGDARDRMVLAENASEAAAKVTGAERIILAAPSLVW